MTINHSSLANGFKWLRQCRDWFAEGVLLAVMLVITGLLYGVSRLIAWEISIELHTPTIGIAGGICLILIYWMLRSSFFEARNEYHPISADGAAVMSHDSVERSLSYQGNEAVMACLNAGDTATANDIAELLKAMPLRRTHYASNHHFYKRLDVFVEKYPHHHWAEQWRWYYQNRFGEAPPETNRPSTRHVRAYGTRSSFNQGKRS